MAGPEAESAGVAGEIAVALSVGRRAVLRRGKLDVESAERHHAADASATKATTVRAIFISAHPFFLLELPFTALIPFN